MTAKLDTLPKCFKSTLEAVNQIDAALAASKEKTK